MAMSLLRVVGNMRVVVQIGSMTRFMMSFEVVIVPKVITGCYRRKDILRQK